MKQFKTRNNLHSFPVAAIAFVLALCAAGFAEEVDQFGVFETEFQAAKAAANPYVEQAADATITLPDGRTWKIPLFWDGGKQWKLRVSPDTPGQWSYQVKSADAGLNGKSGAFGCRASKRHGSIKAMEGHAAHFRYQNGAPMWFMGDTAWALYLDKAEEKLDRTAVDHYIDARAAQGFNVMHSMLLSEAGWGNPGGPPFEDIAKETLNPGYWREIDKRLAYLNSKGVVGGLALAWGDKNKQAPYPWRRFPGVEARKRYARYVAARYSAYDVYFILSGEWHAEVRTRGDVTPDQVAQEFFEIGDVVAASDPHGRMIAIHPMTRQGSVREFNAADWMSFGDYQQNYNDLHERILLSRFIGKPVVNSEYGYIFRDQDGDGLTDKSNSLSTEDMRHASWDIVTAGGYLVTGFGTTYFGGNREPGPFDVDAVKNDDWETQIGYIKRFFEAVDWWKLIPADGLARCDSERGKDRGKSVKSKSILRPPERTYWAMTIPGEAYVIYARGLEKPVKLELDSRAGEFKIRLYDPRKGTFTEAQKVKVENSYEFQPPDQADWVLLMERVD